MMKLNLCGNIIMDLPQNSIWIVHFSQINLVPIVQFILTLPSRVYQPLKTLILCKSSCLWIFIAGGGSFPSFSPLPTALKTAKYLLSFATAQPYFIWLNLWSYFPNQLVLCHFSRIRIWRILVKMSCLNEKRFQQMRRRCSVL